MASPSSWFTSEIQQMMFGFGDSKRTLQETAVLVEEIVHQQMVSMILQAADVASIRGDKHISIEDILFLLRKDKVKLKRLLKYYEVRDMKNVIKSTLSGGEESKLDLVSGQEKTVLEQRTMGKNRQICYDFLSSIDQSGELVALFDDKEIDTVKHERLVRAELQAQGMNTQQYMEFCQARQANFSRRYNKSQRFRDWLQVNLSPDIVLSAAALEIFSYLAYETVAQIVDLALIVKQDMRAVPGDPMSKTRPSLCVNYTELHASSVYNKSETTGGASQSPPTDNSNPTPATLGGGSTQVSSTTSTPNKLGGKKKRKRSGPPTTVDISWDCTILPSDVREAMRRYYMDVGPFSSQMKINPHCSPWSKNLCS